MAGFYRTFVGPVIIGVSVWCAAGTVSVLSNSDSTRLVALAPWWVGVIGAALAALVPAWRTRPATTLPALVSTLPWWPIPLPAVALLWTGVLGWLPIGAALLVAIGSRPLTWLGRAGDVHNPTRAIRLAGVASLLIAIAAAWAADPRVPGGDEPHYLVITQSLLKDGDLRIENNHIARDYASYFGGTINPDFLARGRDNVIYSIHAPGVSAIVLPAFAAFGFRGAQATLILLYALAGALMWSAAWRLTQDTSAAWFAWAAVAGSTTMAVLSFMVFPDAPGACAVAAGVWLLVTHRDASNKALMGVSAAMAALPWLHTRFGVLAGAMGVALVAMMLTDHTRPVASRWKRVAVFAVVPVVSAVAWLSMFYVLYGSWDPRVPYGPNPELRPWIWGAVTGLFLDQQFGLFTYAPVLAVAFIGCVMTAPRQWRILSIASTAIVLVYAMAVATYWMWWAGVPGLPARFLTASLPLLVLPIAVTWARVTAAARTVLLALLAASLAGTAMVLGVDRAAMAWNGRDGQAAWLEWLNPVVNLPRAWPSFFWNGEGAFLGHSAVVLTVGIAVCVALRMIAARHSGNPESSRLRASVVSLAALMLIVQAGWTVTGSSPLDPARSQLALHAAAGDGATVRQLSPGIRRWDLVATPFRIHRDQPSLTERASVVFSFVNVPAGSYSLETVSRNLSGQLKASIRRSAPFQTFAVTAGAAQSFPLSLPAGAALLVVEAESPELAGQLEAVLVPTSKARASSAYAREYRRYKDTDAFFLDTNAFPESEGFWVGGGRSTTVALSQGAGASNRPKSLVIANGGTANTVTVRSGAWQEVLTLKPGEERTVALPLADSLGSWPLAFTSSSGFRPSDTAGRDDRFLGAWIALNR